MNFIKYMAYVARQIEQGDTTELSKAIQAKYVTYSDGIILDGKHLPPEDCNPFWIMRQVNIVCEFLRRGNQDVIDRIIDALKVRSPTFIVLYGELFKTEEQRENFKKSIAMGMELSNDLDEDE